MKNKLQPGTLARRSEPSVVRSKDVTLAFMCDENIVTDLESLVKRIVGEKVREMVSEMAGEMVSEMVSKMATEMVGEEVNKRLAGILEAAPKPDANGHPSDEEELSPEQLKSLALLTDRFSLHIPEELGPQLSKALLEIARAADTNDFCFGVRTILTIHPENLTQRAKMLDLPLINEALISLVPKEVRETEGSGFTCKNIKRRLKKLVDDVTIEVNKKAKNK